MAAKLGPGDIAVMVVLFGLTVAKAGWISASAARKQGRDGAGMTPEDFFLAGRSMPFWAVGLSIFASNIGAEHFVGQAGAAAAGGMPVAVYEWSSGLLIFFLGFVLAPRYVRERLTTVPEWFERRFGPKCRLLLALVSVAAYVLTKIAASLFAGAVLMEVVLGVSMWVSSPIILAFTALYAASGGLSAVMYTDVGQGLTFLLGGFIGACYAISEIGGLAALSRTLDMNGLSYFTSTLRPADGAEYAWTGLLIGQPISSFWYWCVDQVIVQRVFSAKSIAHAQAGCTLAGYLKILPPFLMVIPGIVARCLFEECQRTGGLAHTEWCETSLDDGLHANKAYPFLVIKTFPDGLRGLMIVSMVLAMMSSLDSVFNCVSTVCTTDLYVRFLDPGASARRQVWVGRLVTVVSAALGMSWLPMIAGSSSGLYLATQSVMTHLSPTIVGVFLLGLMWPRANGYGAMAGMLGGFALGVARYITTIFASCGPESWASFSCMDFNHMALVLFGVSLALGVLGSLVGERFAGPQGASDAERSTEEAEDGLSPVAHAPPLVEEPNPATQQRLLISGVMLLFVMLVLCVGFGYAAEPSRGHGVTISGGVLASICVIGATAIANAGMCVAEVRPRASKRAEALGVATQ